MKSIALILTVASAALSISSCCCQTQPMPPLRAFPKECGDIGQVPPPVEQPKLVIPNDKGK